MVHFVDQAPLHAQGGRGGAGCASIHREKFRPLGGPDGGNGGNGGDVTVEADASVSSLLQVARRPHVRGGDGRPGAGDHRNGAAGAGVVVHVPPGTVVTDATGAELADLAEPGERIVVAAGGRGGLGNAALAGPRRKAPGFALKGEPGEARELLLSLKLLADVGLVGMPSAGKSSLVAAMSAARPKIADYPFTTLVPHLGVVSIGGTEFTIADVPGLIPGAADGKGLGLEFLRHVERCAVLVHVLDCATSDPGRDPLSDLVAIEAELASYGGLADRPRVVALNKCDVPDAADLARMVRPDLEARGLPVVEVSAASHLGLRALAFALSDRVRAERERTATVVAPRITVRPIPVDDTGFRVDAEPDCFRVTGRRPERWVRQTDFTNDEAVGYLADRLASLGVEDELRDLGAEAGCTVVIGAGPEAVVFEWQPSIAAGRGHGGRAPRGRDRRMEGS